MISDLSGLIILTLVCKAALFHCAASMMLTLELVSNFPGCVVMSQSRERSCWIVMSSALRERASGERGADEAVTWSGRIMKQPEEAEKNYRPCYFLYGAML